jgi:hypothetical protein
MTGKQPIGFAVIAAAAAAVLVVLHLVLPINASWQVNRILHYAWMALVVLSMAGGIVWLMWPRPKARRRDFDRAAARRRVMGLGAAVLAAVAIIIFAELWREAVSNKYLEPAAVEDLQAIGKALAAYEADHGGAQPASIETLAPKYLEPPRLYYAYRDGPARMEPPKLPAAAGSEAGGAAGQPPEGPGPTQGLSEAPSYALVKQIPGSNRTRKPQGAVVAYLRPGNAWSPLTIVLEDNGRCQTVGEDAVRPHERQFETK